MTRVDAVVVAYRSGPEIAACVGSLAGTPGVGVTVVDNGCPERSSRRAAAAGAAVVETGLNGGFAFGVNAGVAAGDAPYVLILNPDAHCGPGTVERLAAVLDARPEVGIAAPRILNADGSPAPSLRRFPSAARSIAPALMLHRLAPRAAWADEVVRDPSAYARRGDVEWASGAALLVRRSLLHALGGLDDGYFMYSEDADLCRRARTLGLRTAFEPGAVVWHLGGRSAPRAALLGELAASRVRYARRHGGRGTAAGVRAGVALSSAVRAGGAAARGRWDLARGHARALGRAVAPSGG